MYIHEYKLYDKRQGKVKIKLWKKIESYKVLTWYRKVQDEITKQ